MSRWKLIVFVGVVMGVNSALPSTTSAQAPVVSREIRIQAQVLPTHTVMIDERGVIQKIISNSPDNNANIKVYMDTVAKHNERSPTPEVMDQYVSAMHSAPKRVGVVYQNTTLPMASLLQATLPDTPNRTVNPIALALISR